MVTLVLAGGGAGVPPRPPPMAVARSSVLLRLGLCLKEGDNRGSKARWRKRLLAIGQWFGTDRLQSGCRAVAERLQSGWGRTEAVGGRDGPVVPKARCPLPTSRESSQAPLLQGLTAHGPQDRGAGVALVLLLVSGCAAVFGRWRGAEGLHNGAPSPAATCVSHTRFEPPEASLEVALELRDKDSGFGVRGGGGGGGGGFRGQSIWCGKIHVSNWARNFPHKTRGLPRNGHLWLSSTAPAKPDTPQHFWECPRNFPHNIQRLPRNVPPRTALARRFVPRGIEGATPNELLQLWSWPRPFEYTCAALGPRAPALMPHCLR